ncbi:stalk domain-containing protein [Paenibacillus elgii]|uniref:stalk domain-containing protein n=1 Tax=Paenibacillus elgii TaxID=189691 RepID=UPI0020403DC9|nr:stalk domain-containing protein [Paenibacillus elgii]MCM3273657.1 copper amine oxidase N-terminal domain-containing protein [Paenibacillus elgii]
MKKLIAGIVIGSALTMTATAGAAAVKQYILTEVAYPIVVNGKEFKDAAAPILNFEGSTYVPLAKLGDIMGTNYKWNDELKRVEIITPSTVNNGTQKQTTDEKNSSAEEHKKVTEGIVEDLKKQQAEAMKITETWIDYKALEDKAGVTISPDKSIDDLIFSDQSGNQLYNVTRPKGWQDSKDQQETTLNGVRIKRVNGLDYYNAEDLRKAGVIK